MRSSNGCRPGISWRVLLVALLTIVAGPAWSATLNGTVTYRTSGMPRAQGLSAALVTVYHTATGRRAITRSNATGSYMLKDIPAGLYVILVEKDGRRIYQGKVEVGEPGTRFDIGL
jgi:carboxypeptidase family protein